MKFKNDRQRKAVMAKLVANGTTRSRARLIIENPSLFNLTKRQLARKRIKLHPHKDFDGDGVVNAHDCKPLNKKEQGIIHDTIAGIGKVAGYVGAEVTTGVKDIKPSAQKQYAITKKKEELKMKQQAKIPTTNAPSTETQSGFFGNIKGAVIDYKHKQELHRQAKLDSERAKIEKLQEVERLRLQKASLQAQQREHIEGERRELQQLRQQRKDLQARRFRESGVVKGATAVIKGAQKVKERVSHSVLADLVREQTKSTPRRRTTTRRKTKKTTKRKAPKKRKKRQTADYESIYD